MLPPRSSGSDAASCQVHHPGGTVIDPVSGSVPRPTGAKATGTTVGKSACSVGGWSGEVWERDLLAGFGVGATQAEPSLVPRQGCWHGWAQLEMPSKETGPSGSTGKR